MQSLNLYFLFAIVGKLEHRVIKGADQLFEIALKFPFELQNRIVVSVFVVPDTAKKLYL